MKIENTQVFGFEAAIARGMRNPKNSWNLSDSKFGPTGFALSGIPFVLAPETPYIGPKDMTLAETLIKAGGDHRKFLRQIQIWVDIGIPRCAWQEFDTYKVATVRNSCSTMHKLGSRNLDPEDFEDEDVSPSGLLELNRMGFAMREGKAYCDPETGKVYKDNALLVHMKYRLPEGFIQMATYTMSYETALRMYMSRKDHRMPFWSRGICPWIANLPYMLPFINVLR